MNTIRRICFSATHVAHHFHSAIRALPLIVCEVRRLGLLALSATILTTLAIASSQANTPPAIDAKGFATGYLYTADKDGNSISEIDLSTGRVTTLPITISPRNVHIIRNGALLLAVGDADTGGNGHGDRGAAHGADEVKGRLLIFETTWTDPSRSGAIALSKEPIADIPVGTRPAHVISDPLGRRAFITNAGDDTVSVVDLAERKVIGTVGTGRYPHGLRMDPDARELYVANVQDGSLSVIDIASLAEVTRIPVGKTPVQLAYNVDGDRVYVSLRDEDRVAMVDTEARALTGTIEVSRSPIQVYATPDGHFVYAVNEGPNAKPADTVSVIDVAADRVVDTIPAGMGAHGISMSRDGAYVFVTNAVDNTVSVIDAATRTVIGAFDVGRGPAGIAYRPW